MTQNSADKLILKALSKPQDKAAKERAVQSLRYEDHLGAFKVVFALYSQYTPQPIPLNELKKLLQVGLLLSGEFLILKHGNDVESLTLEECLSIAPTSKCVNLWIGKGEGAKEKTNSLTQRFRDNPLEATNSILARWYFEFAPLELIQEGVEVFGSDSIEEVHSSVYDLIKIVIERDKHSKCLAAIFTLGVTNPVTLNIIIRACDRDTGFVELLIKRLPQAVQPGNEQSVILILKSIFGKLSLTREGRDKRRLSAQMLLLSGMLIAQPWSVENDRVLAELDAISHNITKALPHNSIDRDLCVINHLGTKKQSEATHITSFGARVVASVLEGVQRGEDATMKIEVAAFNLGMRKIAEVGESLNFEPNLHCDTVGGVVRGDKVIVQTTGWQLGDQLIERANVRPV